MNEFQITWVKDPIEDILDVGSLDFSCGTYCIKKTPESCVYYCKSDQS